MKVYTRHFIVFVTLYCNWNNQKLTAFSQKRTHIWSRLFTRRNVHLHVGFSLHLSRLLHWCRITAKHDPDRTRHLIGKHWTMEIHLSKKCVTFQFLLTNGAKKNDTFNYTAHIKILCKHCLHTHTHRYNRHDKWICKKNDVYSITFSIDRILRFILFELWFIGASM